MRKESIISIRLAARAFLLLSIGLTLTLPLQAQSTATPLSTSQSYYHFSLAKIYHLKGQYSEAISEFEEALKADSSSSILRTEFAKTLLESQDVTRAVEECEAAVELDPENAEAHFLLGRVYRRYRSQDEMTGRALTQFEKVLEIDPEHMGALYDAAEIHREMAEFEEAADLYRRLRTVNPNVTRIYETEADAWLRSNKLVEATEALEAGLRYQHGNSRYMIFLGSLYSRLGREADAVNLYSRELETAQTAELAHALAASLLELDRPGEAIELLLDYTERFPSETQLKLDLGKAYRQSRRLSEASQLFQEVIEKRPDDVDALYELANVLEVLGDKEQSLKLFERLVNMTNPSARLYRAAFRKRLALLYEDFGRIDEAIEVFKSVAEEFPEDVQVKIWLFYALKESSRLEEGFELTDQLLKDHGDDPYVLIARSQALSARDGIPVATEFMKEQIKRGIEPELLYIATSQLYMAEEDYVGAQSIIESGLSEMPDSEKLTFQLGAILERQKEYSSAEEIFQKILAATPDHADVLNYLGYMLAERDERLEEALSYTLKAVELDPYNGAYLDSLGWVYFKLNNLEKAEDFLTRAAGIHRTDPVILEHLGDLYSKMGETGKARDYYTRSVESSENKEETARVQEKLAQLEATPSTR